MEKCYKKGIRLLINAMSSYDVIKGTEITVKIALICLFLMTSSHDVITFDPMVVIAKVEVTAQQLVVL